MNMPRVIICLYFALSSCAGFDISDINVTVPENASIQTDTIRNALLAEFPLKNNSDKNLDITIYDCSLGKERLVYNNDSTITTKIENGYIKLLCAVKKENRLVKTVFIEVSGEALNDMTANLVLEVKKILQ